MSHRLLPGEQLNLFGENARGINDVPRTYSYLLVTKSITYMSTNYFPLFSNKRGNFSVVSDSRAVLSCGANNGHSEPGIVRLRIIVDEAIFQPIGNKRRSQLHHLFTTQMTMPLNAASTCHRSRHEIIKPKSNIQDQTKPNA